MPCWDREASISGSMNEWSVGGSSFTKGLPTLELLHISLITCWNLTSHQPLSSLSINVSSFTTPIKTSSTCIDGLFGNGRPAERMFIIDCRVSRSRSELEPVVGKESDRSVCSAERLKAVSHSVRDGDRRDGYSLAADRGKAPDEARSRPESTTVQSVAVSGKVSDSMLPRFRGTQSNDTRSPSSATPNILDSPTLPSSIHFVFSEAGDPYDFTSNRKSEKTKAWMGSSVGPKWPRVAGLCSSSLDSSSNGGPCDSCMVFLRSFAVSLPIPDQVPRESIPKSVGVVGVRGEGAPSDPETKPDSRENVSVDGVEAFKEFWPAGVQPSSALISLLCLRGCAPRAVFTVRLAAIEYGRGRFEITSGAGAGGRPGGSASDMPCRFLLSRSVRGLLI